MLISKEDIVYACNLFTDDVFRAMRAGGYSDLITGTKFLGMSELGTFVYEITYPNDEGDGICTGKVYLKFVEDEMQRSGYSLQGEY